MLISIIHLTILFLGLGLANAQYDDDDARKCHTHKLTTPKRCPTILRCSNGGVFNYDSCLCDCYPSYTGDRCERVLCDKEPDFCIPNVLNRLCEINWTFYYLCPIKCGICPKRQSTVPMTTKCPLVVCLRHIWQRFVQMHVSKYTHGKSMWNTSLYKAGSSVLCTRTTGWLPIRGIEVSLSNSLWHVFGLFVNNINNNNNDED